MTPTSRYPIATIAALLALGSLGGCANLWGQQHRQASAPPPTAMASATQAPVSPALVKQVQSKLRDAGYYKSGNIDGVWGGATRTAVQKYQNDHSLNASGQLDAQTLQAMDIPSDQASNNNNASNNSNNASNNNNANNSDNNPSPAPRNYDNNFGNNANPGNNPDASPAPNNRPAHPNG